MRMGRDAANESLQSVPKRLNILNDAITESISFNATKSGISLRFWSIHLEGQFVCAMEEEDLEVLDFCIGEQDDIFAEV